MSIHVDLGGIEIGGQPFVCNVQPPNWFEESSFDPSDQVIDVDVLCSEIEDSSIPSVYKKWLWRIAVSIGVMGVTSLAGNLAIAERSGNLDSHRNSSLYGAGRALSVVCLLSGAGAMVVTSKLQRRF
ncbi:hypothetical protein Lepto7375DRAFT_1788 [Leptolyngbya sp. PCC 7375]|nr:hypothetical protein Lepto7375DRAFT_1788 [Leptolyngbya sp. PCC 7375]